jgi:hypothetical protein
VSGAVNSSSFGKSQVVDPFRIVDDPARRSILIATAIQPESLELVVTRMLVRGDTRTTRLGDPSLTPCLLVAERFVPRIDP